MLKGCATPEATKRYADKQWEKRPEISPNSWRLVHGLTVGKVGFGSCRLTSEDGPTKALRKAILSGVNLIDTAPNFSQGLSEEVIGSVLTALIENGDLQREGVVLLSKGGYFYTEDFFEKEGAKGRYPLNDYLSYSINPDDLREQFYQTCERLNVETLDGYFLQHPEAIFQSYLMEDQEITADIQNEFYIALEDVFAFLEEQVQEGALQFYGVSSNTIGLPADHPDHICLNRLYHAAEKGAQKAWGRKKKPRFECVSLPLNILELTALHTPNHRADVLDGTEQVPFLEMASRRHLSVFAQRPLNAFPLMGGVYRLAQAHVQLSVDVLHDALDKALSALIKDEENLQKILAGWPQVEGQPLFNFSGQGDEVLGQLTSGISYDHLESSLLRPHMVMLTHALKQIAHDMPEKKDTLELMEHGFLQKMSTFMAAARAYVAYKDTENARALEMELRERLPENWRSANLQQIALNAIASLPGVTAVLNGMRQEAYVDDALATYTLGDFVDAAKIVGSVEASTEM